MAITKRILFFKTPLTFYLETTMKRNFLLLLFLAQSMPTLTMLKSHQQPLLELSDVGTHDPYATHTAPPLPNNTSLNSTHNDAEETDYSDPAYDNVVCLPRCCFRLDDALLKLNRCTRMTILLGYFLSASSLGFLTGYIARHA